MKRKKGVKIFYVVGAVLIFLLMLPYALPLTKADSRERKPFVNSYGLNQNGIYWHYRMDMPEEEPIGKVVWVHGMGGSTYSFETLSSRLVAEGYLVVSVDLPGFGYSSRQSGFHHTPNNRALGVLNVLEAVEAALNLDPDQQPWYAGGHSMGGAVVTAMALEDQERIGGMILIAGALLGEPPSAQWTRFAPIGRWLQVGLEYIAIREKNIYRMLLSAYGSAPSEDQVEGYLTPLLEPGTARNALEIIGTSGRLDLDDLIGLDIPVLGIWGEKDTWVPVEQLDQLERIWSHMDRLVIKNSGHCPMETHVDAVDDALRYWLGNQLMASKE